MDSIPHDSSPSSAENPWPNCGVLLSSAKFEPILTPLKKPNFSPPPNILALGDHIHSTLLSASHKCLGFIHSLASQNPLLAKALSLQQEYRTFCNQIRCRNKANSFPSHCFAAVLPGDSVAALVVANGLNNFLNLYNTVLLVRLVLTWFPNAPPAIVSPLSTVCDPYLNIFRGLIPPLGGTLDLSPILAFLVLNAFTSTAAALPAELPTEQNQCVSKCPTTFFDLSASQKKWMRRLQARNITKSSSEEN